jgi:hypothetical protein
VNYLRILFILFLGFGFACTGPDESPKALINVFLIDAPAQWDSVVVELKGVELDLVPSGREGAPEKIFLPYELADKQIDLAQLVAGISLPVGRTEIKLGKITGATLRLGAPNTLYKGDKGYPLALPNGSTDFYKEVQIDLQAGISYDLILDFDLEKSIRQTSSNPIAFSFNPTLRVYSDFGKGSLNGIVTPTSLSPSIYAIQGTDSISTHTNSSGSFSFRLDPGVYTLYIEPKNPQYQSKTISNLEVKKGEINTLNQQTLTKK